MKKIILIVGYPAAGKSTLVKEFTDQGFERVNRDTEGGKVSALVSLVEKHIKAGKGVVLDNTFPTIESRKPFIDLGQKLKVSVECVWLTSTLEDAQLNACMRMMQRFGRIFEPEEFKTLKNDPNSFPPAALFTYRKAFQKPTTKEGFAKVEERPFVRVWGPEYVNKAVILDYDGTLRVSTGKQEWPEKPEDVKVLPGRAEVLKRWKKKGYLILGASNQSAIAKGLPLVDAVKCFAKTNDDLGLKIDYQFCPHKIPPLVCYCRKPSVGMGAFFIHRYHLNPAECIMVGDSTSDKTFAERCGFRFESPETFFGT